MRGRRFLLLFYLLCILSFCLGTVWKTEDAYIIDDTIDDPVERVATKESTNVCFDSTGAEGRCVSIQECSPFSNFFSIENNDTRLEILEGLKRHLNSSGEPCIPTSPVELPTTSTTTEGGAVIKDESNFVCCISLKYSNVRIASSLDEYLLQSRTPQSLKEPTIPQVPPGIGNSTGVAVADTYIVSGSVARIGEFPFAVAIIYNGKQFCGGSLLDSQWILSAAHCFDQFNSEKVRRLAISIGDHDLSTNNEAQNQVAYVSKLFLHPGFFRSKGYFVSDVALIKLKNPIYGYSNVRTVSLHSGTPNIYQGNVEVIGWGKTCDHNSCPQSSTLLKTTVQVISNTECSQRFRGTAAPPINQGMVCALGSSGRDACFGDSGGPLVIRDHYGQTQQIGIVSFGLGCGGKYPGVYTRLSQYIQWIYKHKNRG